MASSPHKALPRRLFEVLEEQQEPFILDVCLLGHGFSERIVQSKPTFLCWRPRRKRGGSWGCLPTKLRCWGGIKRALNWHSRAPHHGRWSVSDCFAEARSTRRVGRGFHRLSCSGASTEAELNGDADWKEYELSPVSVLDVHSDEDSCVHNHSSSAMEVDTVSFAQLPLCKEAKREVAAEEINCAWGSQRRDLALITNLISLDLKNWGHFQDQKREIGIEIEGFILEELREECVLDMLQGFHCTLASCWF